MNGHENFGYYKNGGSNSLVYSPKYSIEVSINTYLNNLVQYVTYWKDYNDEKKYIADLDLVYGT